MSRNLSFITIFCYPCANDDFETWKSKDPIIDIRHSRTFSPTKVTLKEFRHQPTGWKEIPIDEIQGWNLRKMFDFEIFENPTRNKGKR